MHNMNMNRLSVSLRAQVIAALVEGNSIRGTCRMVGVTRKPSCAFWRKSATLATHTRIKRSAISLRTVSNATRFGASATPKSAIYLAKCAVLMVSAICGPGPQLTPIAS